MLTLTAADQLAVKIAGLKKSGKTVGFVPTMGCLHAGHLALVKQAGAACDVTVVSIFVNPKQFAPGEDYARYPRDLERDAALLSAARADILFAPDVPEIYPPDNSARLLRADAGLSGIACGLSRPGHFDGVVTVVARLFDLVQPDKAFFGQKDYQQLRIIQKMTAVEKYPIEIIACPIVRESAGLAMSSRNKYLAPAQRKNALALSRGLQEAAKLLRSGSALSAAKAALKNLLENTPETRVDYAEILDRKNLTRLTEYKPGGSVILLAAYVGGARLIDNIEI
ncbi:MAG: pantoate--beta-alanine ligase [Candidatus Margulisbacteria bacterium]|jgi:pantoate--beta-alanine ligase|nr:pantoate--beta-alanine ligase [Candidatus Margulisiibacteriota bacterium]